MGGRRAERRHRRSGARFARRAGLVLLLVATLLVATSTHAAELCTAGRHAAGATTCAAHRLGPPAGVDGSAEHRAPRRPPCCSASVALSGIETKRIEGKPGAGASVAAPVSTLAAVRSHALAQPGAPSLLDRRRPDPTAGTRRHAYLENRALIL
jgi:hypothetical protein